MDDAREAWLSSSIGRYAQAYAKTSYVIPLHGITSDLKCTCGHEECKSPGKHPFTKHGLKDASNDIEQIAALFNYRTDLNIGLLTGEKSGFFALDVDGRKGGYESLDALFKTYGEFEPTVIIKTGSGVHIWFEYPTGIVIGNRTDFVKGLDIRGNGGYVVAAPSLHASGVHYEKTETSAKKTVLPPQWLIDLIQTKKKEAPAPLSSDHSTGARSEWSKEEVERMLDVIDPDINYQQWVEVGMALHSGGFPLSLWDSWSRTGEKYENGDCEKRWHGFNPNHGITMGTLVAQAQLNGWKPKIVEREAVDTGNVEPLVKKAAKALRPSTPKKVQMLGIDPLKLPGLIGDTVRWITKYARRKQPELALLNTLAFAGAVFGRKYSSPINTRTNIYVVGIADTGCHAKNTKILMSDGSVKNVQDVIIGDKLMGPDSLPRRVKYLCRGNAMLYKITPTKGEPFIVNGEHVLHLKKTKEHFTKEGKKSKIVHISVNEYIKQNYTFKHVYKLERKPIDFPYILPPTLDPWFLGALIGDGHFGGSTSMVCADKDIEHAAFECAAKMGIIGRFRKHPEKLDTYTIRFSHSNKQSRNGYKNKLTAEIKKYGLYGVRCADKFIPDDYKYGSRHVRLNILAGLLDTDGSLSNGGYDFITKSTQLAKDVVFICRSLGLAAYSNKTIKSDQRGFSAEYTRISISGDCSIIPMRCIRKKSSPRKQIKSVLVTGFKIEKITRGKFYGFNLDKDHLYLTADFIVHHNSGKDHSRKAIKELAHAAGLDERIGADAIRSDAGMLRGLMNNSSQLMMIDEFGHFLQAISNEKAPHYVRSQIDILLKLYSHSNSIYNHGDYSDPKLTPIVIQSPNLCIYGTSTEEKYAKSLRKSAIESGEINRFITLKAGASKEYPEKDMPPYEIPRDLIERWAEFSPRFGSSLGELVNNTDIAPEIVTVKWGKCDEIQYAIECRNIDKTFEQSPLRHLWGRLFENTVKIAMILAIARNRNEPEFQSEDFDLAQLIVESSIEYLTHLAGHSMSETPQEESNNEIIKALADAGGVLGRRDIMRKFRKLKKRDLDEILNGLIEQEMIEALKDCDGKGRPKTIYKLIIDEKEEAA